MFQKMQAEHEQQQYHLKRLVDMRLAEDACEVWLPEKREDAGLHGTRRLRHRPRISSVCRALAAAVSG